MRENFLKAIEFVLYWEKYISNHPKDPGGLTVWGVSKKQWPEEVEKMRVMTSIQAQEYATQFYKIHYWDLILGDTLSNGMDMVTFDCAVNQGVSIALELKDISTEWKDLLILRVEKYSSLPTWRIFSRGWIHRIMSLYKYILSDYKMLR